MEAWIIGESIKNNTLRILDLSESATVRLYDYNKNDVIKALRENRLQLSNTEPLINRIVTGKSAKYSKRTQFMDLLINLDDNSEYTKECRFILLEIVRSGPMDYTLKVCNSNGRIENLSVDDIRDKRFVDKIVNIQYEPEYGYSESEEKDYLMSKTKQTGIMASHDWIKKTPEIEESDNRISGKIRMVEGAWTSEIMKALTEGIIQKEYRDCLAFTIKICREYDKPLALYCDRKPQYSYNTVIPFNVKEYAEKRMGVMIGNNVYSRYIERPSCYLIFLDIIRKMIGENKIELSKKGIDNLMKNGKQTTLGVGMNKKLVMFCVVTMNKREYTVIICVEGDKVAYTAAWIQDRGFEREIRDLEQAIGKTTNGEGCGNITEIFKKHENIDFGINDMVIDGIRFTGQVGTLMNNSIKREALVIGADTETVRDTWDTLAINIVDGALYRLSGAKKYEAYVVVNTPMYGSFKVIDVHEAGTWGADEIRCCGHLQVPEESRDIQGLVGYIENMK